MISSKLDQIWRDEARVENRGRLEGQLLDLPNVKAYAGLEPGSERRFLAFRLDQEQRRSIKDRRLRSTRGIATTDVSTDGLVVMTELPGSPSSVFPAVIADVLAAATSAEPSQAVRRAFDRFNSWQAALERQSGPMTAREVRGAIGELIVLRDILIPVLGIYKALDRWTALGRAPLHDFAGESWIVEAKACLSPRARFHVSRAGQLEADVPGTQVCLVVVELEQLDQASQLGTSLEDLVLAVESFIGTSDERAVALVHDALVRRGLRAPDIEVESRIRYGHRATLCFKVDEGFPLLRVASIPRGVEDASYDVDLHECMPFKVDSDAIMQTILQYEGAQ